MPEYVRALDKGLNRKVTVVRSAAEADPDAFQILKEAAVDHNDRPLPPEFAAPAAALSGHKATDNNPKESA